MILSRTGGVSSKIADPALTRRGGGQQPALLVGADVAHGHAAEPGPGRRSGRSRRASAVPAARRSPVPAEREQLLDRGLDRPARVAGELALAAPQRLQHRLDGRQTGIGAHLGSRCSCQTAAGMFHSRGGRARRPRSRRAGSPASDEGTGSRTRDTSRRCSRPRSGTSSSSPTSRWCCLQPLLDARRCRRPARPRARRASAGPARGSRGCRRRRTRSGPARRPAASCGPARSSGRR